ncbi:hypothetical protein [Flavobacterium sp.]|uniref:hypothetical protein n=1 Tax=Flavobacterium sp. TaxID=239 RepID=UPI0040340A2B
MPLNLIDEEDNIVDTIPNLQRKTILVNSSKSHFFLEISDTLTFAQSNADKFGAISDNEFSTTATVSFQGSRKVYAITDGQVLLQPHPDSTKINLILKPYRQPVSRLSIKYFIYRGLKRSDFLTSGTNPTIAGSTTTGTDFVKHVWKEFSTFLTNSNSPAATPLSAVFLGFPGQNSWQTPNHLIDQLYFKVSPVTADPGDGTAQEPADAAFELPLISRGMYLGTAENTVGLDIVLNNGDYIEATNQNPFKLDLAYARASSFKLSSVGMGNLIVKKLLKDNCRQFLDAAAFYGLHGNGQGKLFQGNSTDALTSKEQIYALLKGFATKNMQYVYISSNRLRGYNFYNNYTQQSSLNNIRIGGEGSTSEKAFGTFGWPIESIEPIVTANTLRLEIQLLTGAPQYFPSMFTTIGRLYNDHINNLLDKYALVVPSQVFSVPLLFDVQVITDNAVNKPVCTFHMFSYEVNNLVPDYILNLPDQKKREHKVFNEMFRGLGLTPLFQNEADLKRTALNNYQLLGYEHFQDNLSILQQGAVYFTGRHYSDIVANEFTTEQLVLFTSKKVAEMVQISTTTNPLLQKTVVGRNSLAPDPQARDNFAKALFGDGQYIIEYKMIKPPLSQLTKVLRMHHLSASATPYFCLGITKGEYDVLLGLLPQNASQPSLCVLENTTEVKTDELNGFYYYEYSLGVLFENSAGTLQALFPSQAVLIYSTDFVFFNSKQFGDFYPGSIDGGKGDNLNTN